MPLITSWLIQTFSNLAMLLYFWRKNWPTRQFEYNLGVFLTPQTTVTSKAAIWYLKHFAT